MILIETLKLATEYLLKNKIESARLNSELILCKILKCDRVYLYSHFDQPLKSSEVDEYRSLLLRRAKNEPLQYILEDVKFYGINLKIKPGVLIPRPETELLVDVFLKNNHEDLTKILDIGLGSGNISLAIAKNLPNTIVYGLDINKSAIELSKFNAEQNNINNVNFFLCDIFTEKINYFDFDSIISNPPYIDEKDKANLQKEIIMYEPPEALFVKDEMIFYEKICILAQELLAKSGKLFFEMGINQSDKIYRIMERSNFKNIQIIKDYAKIDRIIFGEKN